MLLGINNQKIVIKYGGSSQSTHDIVAKTIDINSKLLLKENHIIEVVSAPGKSKEYPEKLTNLAIAEFKKYTSTFKLSEVFLEQTNSRFCSIFCDFGIKPQEIKKLILNTLTSRLENVISKKNTLSSRDLEKLIKAAIVSAPEEIQAKLKIQTYKLLNIPAHYLDPLNNFFCDGSPDCGFYNFSKSIEFIKTQVNQDPNSIGVRPGFQGTTNDGDISIFPRGGSDISGAIDAEALNADYYFNCSDVNGVMEVDPRLFEDEPKIQNKIKTIPNLSFNELEELAITGASVIHPLAITPLRRANIKMIVCNTFDLNSKFTTISSERCISNNKIKGIAFLKNLGYVILHSPDMLGKPGYAQKFSDAFVEKNIDIEMIYTSPTTIVANSKDVENLYTIEKSLSEYGKVYLGKGTSMISIVGDGYQGNPKIAIDFLTALAKSSSELKILRQTQALSCSYWVSIDNKYITQAAKETYKHFFL